MFFSLGFLPSVISKTSPKDATPFAFNDPSNCKVSPGLVLPSDMSIVFFTTIFLRSLFWPSDTFMSNTSPSAKSANGVDEDDDSDGEDEEEDSDGDDLVESSDED